MTTKRRSISQAPANCQPNTNRYSVNENSKNSQRFCAHQIMIQQFPHRTTNNTIGDNDYHQQKNYYTKHAAHSISHVQINICVLIAIGLFINCIIIVAPTPANNSPISPSNQYRRAIASNSYANDPQGRQLSWNEIQRKSLNHRSVAQPPQDFGNNFFSTLDFFIQSRQRNASELAGNIFFKYYNT